MNRAILDLIEPFGRDGVYVDSGLLLLHYVGQMDATLVRRFKRTATYNERDFELLEWTMSQYRELFTTPNTLTEVSDLANQLPGDTRRAFYEHLSGQVAHANENYVESVQVVRVDQFTRFGLADSAIAAAAAAVHPVLTDDFDLANYLAGRRAPVVNFNYLRQLDLAS